MNNTTANTDTQTLTGQTIPAEYLHQYQDQELLAADDFDGYEEFSQELDEQAAWNGAKEFNGILVKRACEHATCGQFECAKSTRLGGIEI